MNNFKVGYYVICRIGDTTDYGTDIHKIIRIEDRGEGKGYNYYFEDSPDIPHESYTMMLPLVYINDLYKYKEYLNENLADTEMKLEKLADHKKSVVGAIQITSDNILAITDNLMKLSLSGFPKINELLKKRDV